MKILILTLAFLFSNLLYAQYITDGYCGTFSYNPSNGATILTEITERPTLSGPEQLIESTHFVIHYTLSGSDATTLSYAQAVSSYAETSWQIIKEADTFPNEDLLAKPLLSVYGRNPKDVYLVGRRIYRKTNNEWLEVGNFSTIHKKIRGSNSNNIFVVSNQATVYHYNGVNWLNLEPTSNTNIGFYGVFVTDNKVFIVGDNNSTAFIYKGENF